MARINIEDSIFREPKFIDYCIAKGDKEKALGALVWAFIIAQKFFLDESNDRLIPLLEWQRSMCDDKLIEFGMAEKRDKGIYVNGSEKQFKWLVQRSNAGKNGGGSNRIKRRKKATVVEREATVEQPLTLTLTPSLSLSPTLTQTHSLKNISEGVEKPPSARSLGSRIWECYAQEYKKRWSADPVRNATTNSQCANLGKRLGEDALEVVKFFLKHNDSFYLKTQHQIGICLRDAESLHVQWQRGHAITSSQIRNAEKTINNQESLNTYFKTLEDKE